MTHYPNIRVAGIRTSIPSGYVLGRQSPGTGDVQLIRHDDLAARLLNTGVVVGPATQGWQAGQVSAVDTTEIVINSQTLTLANRGAGTLMGNSGTAAAKPGDVSIGTGLSLSSLGTLALSARAAGTLMGNPGTAAATPSDIAIGSGLSLSSTGTLSATATGAGTVTQVATSGAGISGGPITTVGTLTVEWNAGTVSALGNSIGVNSGTIDVKQQPTYFSASRTLAASDNGSYLVDHSTGTADVIVTLPTFAAGTTFWCDIQNNSKNHLVRLRPAGTLVPTIDDVANSDYLLPTFSSARISIDSTGTAYTVDTGTTWWQPSAGYVSALNGLTIVNNGTFDTNGTLTPVVDGTSIQLSSGTLTVPSAAKTVYGTQTGTSSNSANLANGNVITFNVNTVVSGMHCLVNAPIAAQTYTAQICQLNGSNVVQAVSNATGSIAVANGFFGVDFTFSPAVTCTAGTPYAFMLVNQTSASNTHPFLTGGQTVFRNAKVPCINAFIINTSSIAVGATLTASGNPLQMALDVTP